MISVDDDLPTQIGVAHDQMHIARRDNDSTEEWSQMQVTDHLLDLLCDELKAANKMPALSPELDAYYTVIEKPKLVRLSQVRAAR